LTDAVILTHGLGRTFAHGTQRVEALSGLDLEVRRGEVFGLLGHNGSGKTTTVRLLNGILRPSAGSATVLGLDPGHDGPALRARSGVLTETPALDERLPAHETLALFGRIYGLSRKRASARATALLEAFALADRAKDLVGSFSKGMKQRMALARTLVHEPELLFLDEPTAGLDPVAARDVHDLVRTVTAGQGRTVVLCTHNLVEAQRLCDRVAVLRRGMLVAVGAPDALGHGPHGGHVRLEVPPDRRSRAVEAVRDALGVDGAAGRGGGEGSGVRAGEASGEVILDDAAPTRVAAAVAALVHAGVPVYAAVPSEASLEDAYFQLVGDAGAGEHGG
jgi:ABC-2 type transport system ATP-binding protein